MQIKLSRDRGIHVLAISGDITIQKFPALKAGITKLFKDGKNKMALDLTQVAKMDPDALRELAQLNTLARELSGEIVVAGINQGQRSKIEFFSKPPILMCFDTLDLAIQSLTASPPPEPAKPSAAAAPSTSTPGEAIQAGGMMELLEKQKAEIQDLREKLKQRESGDLDRVRKENESLRKLNETLQEGLSQMVAERHHPPDKAAYLERIQNLELQNMELLEKLQGSSDGAKAQKPA